MLTSDFIESIDIFSKVDAETSAALAKICTPLKLTKGEHLIEAGTAGSDLYLLESGCLEVALKDDVGVDRVVGTLLPGQSVGEAALLTGTNRSTSVRAVSNATLFRITRSQFEEIARLNPNIHASVESAVNEKIHSAHLSSALYENHILGKLDAEILEDLHNEMQLVALKKGDKLFEQGDTSDSLFIVISGRLRVFEQVDHESNTSEQVNTDCTLNDSKPELRSVLDIGRGQTVGEIGFLSGEPRNASVYALRDALVGRLEAESYFKLLEKYPEPLTRLFSSRILNRLVNPPKKRNRTFAVIGINPAGADLPLPIDDFAKRLCWHLENPWSCENKLKNRTTAIYINEQATDKSLGEAGLSQAPIDSAAHLRLHKWFNEQEGNNEYLFLGANYFSRTVSNFSVYQSGESIASNWIKRISQQVDHIIFVARADADVSTIDFPALFASNQGLPLNPGCSLVLLHPENCLMPKDTHNWLTKFNVDAHHHIRWSDSEESDWKNSVSSDIARVSRLLSHQGVGLVLSGGAARGFAHLGVVRALHEAGVPIDLFGGASAGAICASIIASGHSDDQARDLVMKYGKRKNMNDYTLPSTSLFKGKRFSALLKLFVGDIQIEDLWTPFYCVSVNMVNASEVVHRRGLLWKYVRASASMPIMLPPVADGEQLLADGAVLNGLPVEIMSNDPGCGTVIGIDVSGGTGMRGKYVYGMELSGWRQLLRKFNPFTKPYRSPALSTTILSISAIGAVGRIPSQKALADLYIRPPVYKFKMMDYDSREQIMEAGYQAGKSEIAEWMGKNSVARA